MAYRLEPEVQSVSQNKFRKIQAEVFLKLTYHLGPLANHRKCQTEYSKRTRQNQRRAVEINFL